MPEHKYRHLFADDEWHHFIHIGHSIHDPKEKKEFYADIMERKTADPKFSVFDRYPVRNPVAKEGIRICGEVLEMLRKAHGAQRKDSA